MYHSEAERTNCRNATIHARKPARKDRIHEPTEVTSCWIYGENIHGLGK